MPAKSGLGHVDKPMASSNHKSFMQLNTNKSDIEGSEENLVLGTKEKAHMIMQPDHKRRDLTANATPGAPGFQTGV